MHCLQIREVGNIRMTLNQACKVDIPIISTSALPELTVMPKLAISALVALGFVVSPAGTTGGATGGAAAKDNEEGSDNGPPCRTSL